MDQQKTFDFPRAVKLRSLERIVCPGGANVKSLLKALDGFARDSTTCTETLKRISVSMGVSVSTAKRARRAAQDLGLLTVFGDPRDGRSNTYAINWQAVFNLPESTGIKPRSKSPDTPVKLTGDPGQVDRGPRSSWTGTQVKLTGALRTDPNDQINATVRSGTDSDGGGGGGETSNQGWPSGWWAWSITRADLAKPAEVVRLFRAAVDAGVIHDTPVDRVRFVALAIHTASQEAIRNPCGYLVQHVERGTWNYLSRDAVERALKKLAGDGLRLTAEQMAEVRKPSKILQTV